VTLKLPGSYDILNSGSPLALDKRSMLASLAPPGPSDAIEREAPRRPN
jgi:hypothetical protein